MSLTKNTFDPTAIFVQKADKGDALTIKRVALTVVAGAVDSAIVTAVTGKQIRVLNVNAKANTATVAFSLRTKPAGAGTRIFSDWAIYQVRNFWQSEVVGLCDTVVSEGLAASVGAGSDIEFTVSYIEVTP